MPGLPVSRDSLGCSSAITSSAESERWLRGLRRMNMRPLFVVPPPPPPAEDMKSSTLGSWATIAATACWWVTMASNEVPSAVSVVTWSWLVSSLGMKPLGTRRNSATVPSRMPTEKTIAVRR